MRRGILSDEAIKRMFPEHFPPDFRTHQLIYEDGVDVPKHRLTGIKRSKCIWHGSAFRVPQRRGVAPVHVIYKRTATGGQSKYAPQAGMLGGTSHRTKRIRSATPRGWAQAVCEANSLT